MSKIGRYKQLEDIKKELEAYKVIFSTVPRLNNNKTGNKTDDFAVSSAEMGKFVASVKNSLKEGVDFKAAPLEDFKVFDFAPSANEKNLLDTELRNIMLQTGLTDAVTSPSTVNMASAALYKIVNASNLESLYQQFNTFCEYQVNKRTKKYKFKIKFVGNIFNRDERRKNADSDMQNGLITPAIFSSRSIQLTDANNVINMMYSLSFPNIFKPVQTSSTLSNKSTDAKIGRDKKDDSELTDTGADTRTYGSNEEKQL
jgi:hypothetical protein